MKLTRSFVIYFLTFFLNAAFSFIVFSITSHYLNEKDLGVIYLYNASAILLVPFISIGTQFVLSVEFFRLQVDKYRDYFSNGVMIPLITTVLFSVIFLLFYYPLQRFIPVNFFFAVTLPFSCFLIIMNEIFAALVRNKEKHIMFAIYSVARNLLEIAATILLVVVVGMNWQGRLASALLSALIAGIVIFYFLKRWNLLTGKVEKKQFKEIIRTGLPFIPERFSIFILAYSAGFFINQYKGIGDVGYYGAGMQIATIVNVSILALINIFHPVIFKNLAGEPGYSNLRKATLSFLGISLFITVAVIAATPLVFNYFIGPDFQPGKIYAVYLSAGYFFWSVYAVFLGYMLFLKKNRTIMLISIIGMVASISMNTINVKNYGAMGAVYTSIAVYFLMAVMMVFAVSRNFNLKEILFKSKREKNPAHH